MKNFKNSWQILALVNLIRSGNPSSIYYSSNHLL